MISLFQNVQKERVKKITKTVYTGMNTDIDGKNLLVTRTVARLFWFTLPTGEACTCTTRTMARAAA